MCKQHLNTFSITARSLECFGFRRRPGYITGLLIDATRDLAPRCLGAALCLKQAATTVARARTICLYRPARADTTRRVAIIALFGWRRTILKRMGRCAHAEFYLFHPKRTRNSRQLRQASRKTSLTRLRAAEPDQRRPALSFGGEQGRCEHQSRGHRSHPLKWIHAYIRSRSTEPPRSQFACPGHSTRSVSDSRLRGDCLIARKIIMNGRAGAPQIPVSRGHSQYGSPDALIAIFVRTAAWRHSRTTTFARR
jgi:hypothetical protein